MSKKHYIVTAEILAESVFANEEEKTITCMRFAKMFENDNPLFNKSKFLTACGIPDSLVALLV